jgi:sorting nexin-1/2
MLGSAEEDTSLARALSQLADVVERVDHVYMDQSNADFFTLSEFIRDHVGLVHAIKVDSTYSCAF